MSPERSDAIRLAILGAISGAISWALVWLTKDMQPPFWMPGGLWPSSFLPGLVFGIVIGTVLLLRGRLSDSGWIKFVLGSCLASVIVLNGAIYALRVGAAWLLVSCIAAGFVLVFVPVKYVRAAPVIGRAILLIVAVTIIAAGGVGGSRIGFDAAAALLGGLLAGYLFGVLTAYAIRDPNRYVPLLPIIVCSAAGVAFSLELIARHPQWQLAGAFILWHAAYAASLAPLLRVGGVPEESVIAPVSSSTYRAIGFERPKMTRKDWHDAIRLGILGAISGYASSWAMAFVGLRINSLQPAVGLLTAFSVPGLVFGVIVGAFLCLRGRLTGTGLAGYAAASGLACAAAGSVPVFLIGGVTYWLIPSGLVVVILLSEIFRRLDRLRVAYAPSSRASIRLVFIASVAIFFVQSIEIGGGAGTISFLGLVAGFFGSWLLGMAAAILIRAPQRVVLVLPIAVGAAAGLLLPLIAYDDALHSGPAKTWLTHHLPPFSLFLMLWQAAYAASLAPLLRGDVVEASERPDIS